MDESKPHAVKCHGRVISSSSFGTQSEALPSSENAEGFLQLLLSFRNSAPSVTPDLLNLASRADEVAPRVIGSQQNLQRLALSSPIVPPASSVANGMLTLEQQLASLNQELQRRHNNDHNDQLAFVIEQQQGRHQDALQAKNSVLDRMPTIEQQLPLFTDEQLHKRGSDQATSDQKRIPFCIEEQLASLIKQQQEHHAPFQDRIPTFEQRLASLNRPASTSPPPTSHGSSLVQLQLLAQLQRGIVPQAQPEIQAPAGGHPFGNVDQGHLVGPLQSGVPTEDPIPIPPPSMYGPREPFPGKLYRLLAEAERDGNEHIISFTPDGCAFKIHSRERFIQELSPEHFHQAKITSFVRQLNFYGFEKLLDGPNRGGFGHPYFRRGYPQLLLMIERKVVATRPKKDRDRRKAVASTRPRKDRPQKDRTQGHSE
jgi:hypothetical protein